MAVVEDVELGVWWWWVVPEDKIIDVWVVNCPVSNDVDWGLG